MKTAILAFLVIAATCPAQDKLSDALSKAIVEEDVNHNLDAAIKAYQSIVERFTADRQAAATALFRLAECYRKQGKTAEADGAYNRLIAEFSDQTTLADRSRKQRTQATRQPGLQVKAQDQAAQLERQQLQLQLEIAHQALAEARRGQQLGARDLGEVLEAQIAVLRAQNNILASEAAVASGPKAEALRIQRRANLVQMFDITQQLVDLEEKKLRLGTGSAPAVAERKLELLKLQTDLARLGR
jgi:hypothetical protein